MSLPSEGSLMISEETINKVAGSKNHKALAVIVKYFDDILKIDEEKRHKILQLRWEFQRQERLANPVFWLDGMVHSELLYANRKYVEKYEQVFGKEAPYSCGNLLEDAKAWAKWQKKYWEDAQND